MHLSLYNIYIYIYSRLPGDPMEDKWTMALHAAGAVVSLFLFCGGPSRLGLPLRTFVRIV